jgi:diamine N-acetyltransferase
MNAATVRRATAEDAYVLGVVGPAAYAEAYAYLWDRADAYSEQLQSFGRALLGRSLRDLIRAYGSAR